MSRLSLLVLASCFMIIDQAAPFHLSFGHRLPLKSVNSPQLNPESHLIRPVECRNANNHSEAGICMFSIDCMQNKGVPLSVCKHKYFVGTCCRLPDYNNFVGIVYDLRDTETNHVLEAREVSPPSTPDAFIGSSLPATTFSTREVTRSTRVATEQSSSGDIDGRYRISSTSLFSSPTTAVPPASSSKAIESARNADGSVADLATSSSSLSSNKLIELASNLESVATRLISDKTNTSDQQQQQQQQQEQQLSSDQQQQKKHTYEIIRDSGLDSEVLSTFSSVHSPPNTILSSKPPPPVKQSTVYSLHSSATENSIFEMSTPTTSAATATTTTTTTTTTTKAPESEAALSSKGAAMPTTSDQEFTLSTSGETSSTPTTSQSGHRPSEEPTTRLYVSSVSRQDLVSSTGAQTTTPFTVSLSTALLPNISSHPYVGPTQPPPTTTSALVSQSNRTTTATSSSSTTSYEQQLANFSQLYSNQHSSSGGEPPAVVATSSHSSRPSLHSTLHAASKIVTGGSSTNNLIPGLSNLQSAILSHIPFKIASGLSSYLQAAMKPTGSKPLISSNTAPSLQFQQQQQQANSSRSPPSSTTTTTTTTTSSSPSSSSVMMAAPSIVGGGVRFPIDNELMASGSSLSAGDRASTVSFPQPTSSAPAAAYDVVRESQRVCGRPQVAHHPSAAPMAEGVNKRMARIVGGNQSSFGQWPWMVSLRQWRKGAFLHKCGAALLNENWAITAAHCVEDVKVSDLLLRLGEFDVSHQEEPYPFIERRVKVVKSHPLFNPKTFEYDLALLRFAEPIKYQRNILPVCVPSGNDSYIDRMATVIGWGRLYEDGPLPDVIQHVDVPIITNNECEKMYKNAGYIEEIPDMFICAGISKGGRDSCEGDSGGPLTMVDHDGRSYLVGIISWGIGCALPSQPGVYTRITAFSGWINELAGS